MIGAMSPCCLAKADHIVAMLNRVGVRAVACVGGLLTTREVATATLHVVDSGTPGFVL
jgi:hypothetical protein